MYYPTVFLKRIQTSDEGTVGVLFIISPYFRSFCLELPLRDNKSNLSCILPPSKFIVKWLKSPKFGMCYHVQGVPGRGDILLHPGNFAGDSTLKYKTHSHGCILPCRKIGKMTGQLAGLSSSPALQEFVRVLNKQTFILEILNDFPSSIPL